MGERPKTLPEVLISLERSGEYLVSNPLVRTYALGDVAFVELLSALRSKDAVLPDGRFTVVDVTVWPFRDGLLGDPTGVDREATLDGAETLARDDAIALAERLMLVTSDEAAYVQHRAPRKNVLDRTHRGTLHQRVGEYVMLELRERDIDDWWVDQKFTPNRRGPRDGLYRSVQAAFMDAYWTEERLRDKRVLDFGCGPGLFARLFASRGATVLGLDTNERHLEVARNLSAEDGLADRTQYALLELPPEVGLGKLEPGSFDLIFLSDVLMFYFHPYDTRLKLDPVALLRDLKKLLAPDSRIVVLEPNGVFWQQPWLGDPSRPFTIVSEYAHRKYGVTPTLEQIAEALEHAGLAITRIRELFDPDGADTGDRGRQFAAEFPVWWLFEAAPAPT